MTPETFIKALEDLAKAHGIPNRWLTLVDEAETAHKVSIGEYKGYIALSNAHKCFFLETTELLNDHVYPNLTPSCDPDYPLLIERLVQSFQTLRSAEVCAINGYPLQGLTIIRNVYDDCVFTSAAMQGLTTFERLTGFNSTKPPDEKQAKKHRKNEEFNVRRKMDGDVSGLPADVLIQLKKINDLFDYETHGGRLSTALNFGWLNGQEALLVVPQHSEQKFGAFINRFIETSWAVHRLLPLLQPPLCPFPRRWSENWEQLDRCFITAARSPTEKLGKPFGDAVYQFITTKFPFSPQSHFPR